ncbi:MAG: hypothetical protein Kow00124_13970 [Anaerolineae bacterium]
MTTLRRVLIGVTVVLLLAGCGFNEPVPAGPVEPGLPQQTPADPPDAAGGRALYAEYCAACHGPQGAGDGDLSAALARLGASLPDLTDPALSYGRSPAAWFRVVTLGDPPGLMPAFAGTLPPAARWDVTYYLYALSVSPAMLTRGEAVYRRSLAGCLGDRAEGVGLGSLEAIAARSQEAIAGALLAGLAACPADDAPGVDDLRAAAAYVQTFGYRPDTGPQAGQPGPSSAAAPDEIAGRVVNRSGGTLPRGLAVTLHGATPDEQGVPVDFLVRTVDLAPDGSFRFEGLPPAPAGAVYSASVFFDGVIYRAAAGPGADGSLPELLVDVYATTADPAAVTVDLLGLTLHPRPGGVVVDQVLVFSNRGDRVYAGAEPVRGAERGGPSVALPAGAAALRFAEGQLGGRFVESGGRLIDMQPVFPGLRAHRVEVSYLLPAAQDGAGRLDLVLELDHAVAAAVVLVGEGLRLRGVSFEEAGSAQIDGLTYRRYLAHDLPPGPLLLGVELTPERADAVPGQAAVLLLAAAALLLGGFGLVSGLRRRPAALLPALDPAALKARQRVLLRQIAELDDLLDAGKIDPHVHEARRAALKAELAESLESEGTPAP